MELRKIIFPLIFLIVLFLVGIIGITQEVDDFDPYSFFEEELEDEEITDDFSQEIEPAEELPEWVKPARWFRSNKGGMAVEELPSRLAALRHEYALVVDFTDKDELPEYLDDYYDERFFIEIRTFYEQGEETRKQWLFRDKNGTTRLIAVFMEPDNLDENTGVKDTRDKDNDDEDSTDTDTIAATRSGFIEIFDESGFITTELKFFDDGGKHKTEYNYKDGIIISAAALVWEEDDEGGVFQELHTDYYRYNRSAFLRAVERIYHREQQIETLGESALIAFPGRILDAAKNDDFMDEKLNVYPEYFGEILVNKNNKMVYTTDERGRVLAQILYDESNDVIWTISNVWSKERIVAVTKTEGDTELVAEYEYDSKGNCTLERNLRNGILERVVRTKDKVDIEELYLNNVLVLTAVWENGRKISESRIRNN